MFHHSPSSSSSAMARFMASLLVLLLVFFFVQECWAATFTLTNNCDFTVWPGVLSNAGGAALSTTGFALQTGESKSLDAPAAWSGRFWGRTLCSTDTAGRFSCGTGDCGSGEVECSGSGAVPPATLAEFTLGGGGGDGGEAMDYYDVSLVDGYNLPVLVAAQGGSGGGCGSTGCVADLNGVCPSDLRVVAPSGGEEVAACKSACEAFGSPQYCCSGAYSNPDTCKPSSYSQLFKNACPMAYSYAFDDATSIFTCASADYLITFCPTATSQKSSGGHTGEQPSKDDGRGSISGMVFLGGDNSSRSPPVVAPAAALAIIFQATLALSWLL